MTITRKNKLIHFLVTFVLVLSLLFPAGSIVRADDDPPPATTEETNDQEAPAAEESSAQEPETDSGAEPSEEPVEDVSEIDETITEEPSGEETVVEDSEISDPIVTEETETSESTEETPLETEESVIEEIPEPLAATATIEVSIEDIGIENDPSLHTGEEVLLDEESGPSLTDEIEALAEINAQLVDENNEPIPLASNLAEDVLTNADPYFTRGGTTYHFYPTGESCGPGETLGVDCYVSDTPIQDAVNMYSSITPNPGDINTIYVLPGTYNESVTIAVADLTLLGNPGDPLIPGTGLGAPVLEGSGGTGITINAEGVTVTGFVIRGYDIGILVSVVSGNNDVNIENNTITDNGTGIQVNKYTGSPGTEIHYNVFYDNDDYALVNNQLTQNTQYINAQNNFWGL